MGTQAIGAALAPDILAGVTIGTDLPEPSTTTSTVPSAIRLGDQALARLEDLAGSPLPTLPPCDDREFAKLIRALDAALPRRSTDGVTGELRKRLYQNKLGGYPHAAVQFMVSTALEELNWFPSIAQCLEIISRWERRDEAVQRKAAAANLARAERQARFDDIMHALERRELDQAGIDALPPRLREIGAERGFLRLHDDGIYRARRVPSGTKGDSDHEAQVVG